MKQLKCMICGSQRVTPFLDLGAQPNGNSFPAPDDKTPEAKYPLLMSVCEDCWLVQLDEYPPPELLFTDHPYVTGLNVPIVRHFEKLSRHVVQKFGIPAQSLVIDIGANDGTLLNAFRDLGLRILGVDPGQRTGRLAAARGVTVCETFWNGQTAAALRALRLRPRLITATAVFYHVPDLHSFVKGLAEAMEDGTVFVTQCVYLKAVLEATQFDHFYHEHTCVFSLRPLQILFAQHGLRLIDFELWDVHGGSFVLYVAKESSPLLTSEHVGEAIEEEERAGLFRLDTYRCFADRVNENCRNLMTLLRRLREQGKTIFAMGAPVKGSTLMNYCGIGPDLVAAAVEVNGFKVGRLTPGTHVPIISEEQVQKAPDYYLVLAWNFLDYFLEKHADFLRRGGKFIVPHPKVTVVDQAGTRDWRG